MLRTRRWAFVSFVGATMAGASAGGAETAPAPAAAPTPAPPPPGGAPGGPTQVPIPVPSQPVPATPPPAPTGGVEMIGQLKLTPRGVIIVNSGYNSGTLIPGAFVAYATPPAVSKSQFYLSPANTVLGFTLTGLTIAGAQLSGGMDANLRSPQPLINTDVISPQFYDAYIQLEGELWRAILGQYPDVLLPFVPDTTNTIPAGYIPGALGYARPQLRGEVRVPFGELFQGIVKGSVAQPIQTFDLPGEDVGRQGGLPDGQLRLSFALGHSRLPWERPFEVGVSGHLGRRRVTNAIDLTTADYRTWSMSVDFRARAPTGTLVKGRVWQGSVLGDYNGGIFQTVDATTKLGVRATGWWIELQQLLGVRWRATVGYGRDNPTNADLGPGGRALNQAGFGNVFWDLNRTLAVGTEVSRWSTSYVAGGTNNVWRSDTVLLLKF